MHGSVNGSRMAHCWYVAAQPFRLRIRLRLDLDLDGDFDCDLGLGLGLEAGNVALNSIQAIIIPPYPWSASGTQGRRPVDCGLWTVVDQAASFFFSSFANGLIVHPFRQVVSPMRHNICPKRETRTDNRLVVCFGRISVHQPTMTVHRVDPHLLGRMTEA